MTKEKEEIAVLCFKVPKSLVEEMHRRIQERGMKKKAWIMQAILLKMAQEDKYK